MIMGQPASDRFLHRRATGFPDEQMAFVQHPREFIGPANDLCRGTVCRRFDSRPKFIGTANRRRQIDAKRSEAAPHPVARCVAAWIMCTTRRSELLEGNTRFDRW